MFNILINLLLYFPIILTIKNLIGININLNIIYSIVLIFILILMSKKNNKIYINLLLIILFFLVQILFLNKYIEVQSLMTFINTITILSLIKYLGVKKLYNLFVCRIKLLNIMIILIMLLNIIYFITPMGWMYLWDENQFLSIYKFPHDACYMFIGLEVYCISLYYLNNNKVIKNLFKIFVILLIIFSLCTNSRTPFALAAFIGIYFLYKTTRNKIFTIIVISNIIIILLSVNYYLNFIDIKDIPIINKFIRGAELGNITSSRNIIWDNVSKYYMDSFLINNKLFGGGFGISRYINQLYMGESLWSHNDFLEILISGGIFPLLYYFKELISVTMISKNKLLVTIIIIIAYFNGFYAYSQITICMPALILAFYLIKFYDNNKININELRLKENL